MKSKLCMFLFYAAFLFCGSHLFSMTSSAEVIANLDWITEDSLEGYAWDTTAPVSLTLNVQIKIEGSDTPLKSVEVVADQYRDDLPELSLDDGCHSFKVPVDWDELGDGTYQIDLYYMEQKICDPVSYTHGEVVENSNGQAQNIDTASMQSLGVFRLTGYCPCYRCSEGWGRHTATGALATANHTIAVDTSVIPFGTQVMINGTVYTAEDRGGGVKGKHIDIFYDTHAETGNHGAQAEVFLLSR